jgi:two-component system, OmpR family, response regulator
MIRILIVEDDPAIASFVGKGLKEAGYEVESAGNAEQALAAFPVDAAVVDIMLPGMDGLAMIERLRQRGDATPILILSARRSVDDRVKGLKKGGDDYLTKPFSFAELLARLQALLRRSSAASTAAPTRLGYADLSLDLVSRKVERAGRTIELQPREFALLEYLLRNPGQVLSKTMILERVWGYDFDPQTNVVDVLVHRLRNNIDRDFEPKLIQTLRGVGYILKAD